MTIAFFLIFNYEKRRIGGYVKINIEISNLATLIHRILFKIDRNRNVYLCVALNLLKIMSLLLHDKIQIEIDQF